MAVAADSHCDFLIPECTVLRCTRQRTKTNSIRTMSCVYSFVGDIIPQKGRVVKSFLNLRGVIFKKGRTVSIRPIILCKLLFKSFSYEK